MLLEFDSSIQSPVVFTENLAGYLYLERDAEIQRYREVLEYLRACALSPANSVKYIEKIRKALEELSSSLRSIIAHLSERKFAMSNLEGSLRVTLGGGQSRALQAVASR
jgi:Domain of unknown function (DUF5753)